MLNGLQQNRAADTLLGKGVRIGIIPTSFSFWLRGVFRIKLTMHQLTIGELYELSAIVARMNLSNDELQKINLLDSYYLTNRSLPLATEALIVALRIKHPFISRRKFIKLMMNRVVPKDFATMWQLLLLHNGVADFINTIRSISQHLTYLSPKSAGSQHTE